MKRIQMVKHVVIDLVWEPLHIILKDCLGIIIVLGVFVIIALASKQTFPQYFAWFFGGIFALLYLGLAMTALSDKIKNKRTKKGLNRS